MDTVLFSKSKSDALNASSSPLPDTAPVKHLKGVVGDGLVHHRLGKFQVLRLCPEQNLLSLFATHIPSLGGEVRLQAIVFDRMVE